MPLVIVAVSLLVFWVGYTYGYDTGYNDRWFGVAHRDDRPSWWRRTSHSSDE